jgi:hypothetical protein
MQANLYDLWLDRSSAMHRQASHRVAAAHQHLYLTFASARFVSLSDHVFNAYGHVLPRMAKLLAT